MFMFDDLKVTSRDDRLTDKMTTKMLSSCKCIIAAWPTSILILCQGPCALTHNTLWHSLLSKSGSCFLVLCNGWHTLNTAVAAVLLQVLHVMTSVWVSQHLMRSGFSGWLGIFGIVPWASGQFHWGTVRRFLRSCVLWQEMEVAFANLLYYLVSVMVRLVAAPVLIDCYICQGGKELLRNQGLAVLPSLVCPEASSALWKTAAWWCLQKGFIFLAASLCWLLHCM